MKLIELISLIGVSLFTGGCIVIAFILVPFWQSMNPIDFLEHFHVWSFKVGVTMLSMELIAQIALFISFLHNKQVKVRKFWLLSTIYFAGVNYDLVHAKIHHSEVHNTLKTWEVMHFVRIVFSMLAILFCSIALRKNNINK